MITHRLIVLVGFVYTIEFVCMHVFISIFGSVI